MRQTLLAIPLFCAIAGCAVGPAYNRPAPDLGAWAETTTSTAATEAAWWRAFGDPTLDDLISAAVLGNLDIRAADARLAEARALTAGAAAAQRPQAEATASASANELSADGQIPINRIPGFRRTFSLYDAGFDASWEIDLWGRLSQQRAGAAARGEAAGETRRDVLVQTIAEVARAYVDLRSAQARLASASRDVEAREETSRLSTGRLDAGEAGRLDQQRAREQARTARSDLPGLRADAVNAAYRLALLTGRRPEAMKSLLDAAAPLPPLPAAISAGLRSDLLRRRADVRAAERTLAAATSDVAVATADLYPRLTLVGDAGRQAQSLSALGNGTSDRYGVGPSLTWPVLSFGRVRAQIRAADARAKAAGAAYEKAVLGALNDSETAINRYNAALAQAHERDDARARSAAALDLVRQRVDGGEDNRLTLLAAQSELSGADQAMLAAHAAALADLIAAYKALGGGWEAFEPTPSAPTAPQTLTRRP